MTGEDFSILVSRDFRIAVLPGATRSGQIDAEVDADATKIYGEALDTIDGFTAPQRVGQPPCPHRTEGGEHES